MCCYRYYYFGTCRHQQTVLLSLCPNALPMDKNKIDALEPPSTDEQQQERRRTEQEPANGQEHVTEEASSNGSTDLSSLQSTTSPHFSHSTKSSIDTGLASATTQLDLGCSSLQPDHPLHSSPTTASSHNMAGLPLFGQTFHQWMSGTSVTETTPSTVNAAGNVFMTNKASHSPVSIIHLTLFAAADHTS